MFYMPQWLECFDLHRSMTGMCERVIKCVKFLMPRGFNAAARRVQVSTFHPTSYSPIFVYLLYIDLSPCLEGHLDPELIQVGWVGKSYFILEFLDVLVPHWV